MSNTFYDTIKKCYIKNTSFSDLYFHDERLPLAIRTRDDVSGARVLNEAKKHAENNVKKNETMSDQ